MMPFRNSQFLTYTLLPSAGISVQEKTWLKLLRQSIKSLPLVYRGKVRDSYAVGDDKLLIVASDRISAFDVILGDPSPRKAKF